MVLINHNKLVPLISLNYMSVRSTWQRLFISEWRTGLQTKSFLFLLFFCWHVSHIDKKMFIILSRYVGVFPWYFLFQSVSTPMSYSYMSTFSHIEYFLGWQKVPHSFTFCDQPFHFTNFQYIKPFHSAILQRRLLHGRFRFFNLRQKLTVTISCDYTVVAVLYLSLM